LWSIFTTPNAISTGIAGRFGSVLNSNVRKGSTTIVITNSDEQSGAPGNMINELVDTGTIKTSIVENFSGLSARRYLGYFGQSGSSDPSLDDVNYTDNRSSVEGPRYLTEFNKFFAGSGGVFNDATWLIEGYFLPPTTGTYQFFTKSDDASYLWIGDIALSGYTRNNAVVNNGGLHPLRERSGTINLTAGIYYPIRIIYGNQNLPSRNPTELTISFSGPNITKRTNGNGYFFSKNAEVAEKLRRTINGVNGELNFRGYRVVALSSYASTDGYDGILFYGKNSSLPYGYVQFTSPSTYNIIRSSQPPSSWVRTVSRFSSSETQLHDTFTIAEETGGALFKIFNVFNTGTGTDRRIAFSKCLAEFIGDTV
jgi:hypothetical protein